MMAAHREMYFHERDASHARETLEQLVTSVASGQYQGAPTQIGLPGLD
nr:H196 [uncultured bacterium]